MLGGANLKKITCVLLAMFLFFGFSSTSLASTYKVKSFKFLNSPTSNNYVTVGLTNYQTLSGKLELLVDDITEAKSYVNFYMATGNAMIKETFSSSDMFFNFQKIPDAQYMYGSYALDVYVVQVTLLGSWNCSAQGTNCTYSGSFSMKNFYNYQTPSRIFSVVTTDERLDPNASVSTNVTVDVQGIINAQNVTNALIDATNKSLTDIKDALQDDNVDTDHAGSFFDSFTSPDHGGISGVIASPLQAINKITDKCSPINFEIFEQEISLPCGDTLFWSKPEVEEFRSFWNILFGGSMIYFLLVKLFKVIEGLKDPNDSKVEVMKL